MHSLVAFALFGLGSAAVYALLAQGAVLIYRGSGGRELRPGRGSRWSAPTRTSRALGVMPEASRPRSAGSPVAAALGLFVQVAVMWPMRRSSALARVVATLGILSVLTQAASIRYTTSRALCALAGPAGPGVPRRRLADAGPALACSASPASLTAALWVFLPIHRGWDWPRSAVAENQTLAASLGWSPRAVAAMKLDSRLGPGRAGRRAPGSDHRA